MSKKILIVEDDELMLEVMTYILMSQGYDVVSAANGNEVFENIKLTHPDLIIMDAILPGLDGPEICQLLKLNRTTKNLPVIMCSGDEDSIERSLKQRGAPNDILIKPFDINSLIEKIEYQLAA
ncbi:MAG TPA: response regulator [Mucilaginibacter sp.]|jgi:DNA-binding response OmpR family regulator